MQHSTFQMIYRQVKHIFVQEKKIEGKIKSHIYLRSHHILHRILTQLLFLDKQYPSWKYKDLKNWSTYVDYGLTRSENSNAMIEKGATSCHRKTTELRLY